MHAQEDKGEYEQNFKILLAHCSTEKNKGLGIPTCVFCMGLRRALVQVLDYHNMWEVCFVVGCTIPAKREHIMYMCVCIDMCVCVYR